MTDKIEFDPLERALTLSVWRAPTNATLLEGGITNVNVCLEDEGKSYVVRLGEDIPVHGVMRFNELAISLAAHHAGLAPRVHHHEPGVLVLEFVDARPLKEADIRDPDLLPEIVDLVRRCHNEVANHLHGPVLTFWVFHVVRDYAATLKNGRSDYQNLLPELLKTAETLEAAVGAIDLVLGHNDLLAANILRDDKRLWLIDWEYGGFNSPLFDLGGLATNNGLNEQQERTMLEQYFQMPLSGSLFHRYSAMKCASLLRETMWSMVSEIHSEIDFDYAAYTEENLSRFRTAMTDFRAL
ncbi:MAG: phosphotransferase [Stappiaceae bacterium]